MVLATVPKAKFNDNIETREFILGQIAYSFNSLTTIDENS